MLLRNLSKFIQLQSISKSRFSRINTNSDITPPNNLDMVYQGITTLISSVLSKQGPCTSGCN
jgi:hypothetical protein